MILKSDDVEIVKSGLKELRRSAMWWLMGILAMVIINIAFWPSIEGSAALKDIQESAPELLRAFGAYDLSTLKGYLDGELYALVLPLLFSGLAIATLSLITSGDEDTGKLELIFTLPVSRQAVWLGRLASILIALTAVTLIVTACIALVQPVFSISGINVEDILEATAGCALLAVFHSAVVYLIGGLGGQRGAAITGATAVLVVGYTINFVFPLSTSLADLQKLSPWYWAIGEQPLSNGIEWTGSLVILMVSATLVFIGTIGITRRDIRAS